MELNRYQQIIVDNLPSGFRLATCGIGFDNLNVGELLNEFKDKNKEVFVVKYYRDGNAIKYGLNIYFFMEELTSIHFKSKVGPELGNDIFSVEWKYKIQPTLKRNTTNSDFQIKEKILVKSLLPLGIEELITDEYYLNYWLNYRSNNPHLINKYGLPSKIPNEINDDLYKQYQLDILFDTLVEHDTEKNKDKLIMIKSCIDTMGVILTRWTPKLKQENWFTMTFQYDRSIENIPYTEFPGPVVGHVIEIIETK